MKTVITLMSFWVVTSAPITAQNQDSVNAAWNKYIETGKIEQQPVAKGKGLKLDRSLGNAPTGTSTGTANPFAPKGYGTDPVDKYINVLPQEFDPDGSKMQAARASYKEAHKYDLYSGNTLAAGITILIAIATFFIIRQGILKESRDKKTEMNNISKKKAASNVSSTSPYKISYNPSSNNKPA